MPARMLLTLLLSAVLVGGCSSEAEEPEGLPPVTPAATASAEPTPAVPSPAQAATPEAAAEFARFFYGEVERAFAERDPEIIRRLSAPGCEACKLFDASLTALRNNNERATDVSFDIVFAEAPAITDNEARVDVIYNTIAVQRFDANGKLIYEEPAVENDEVRLTLVRGDAGWLVRAVEDV